MAEIWKGAPVAKAINERTEQVVKSLVEKGIQPCLAIVRVGERPDDIAYERSSVKALDRLGMQARLLAFPETISQAEMEDAVTALNDDEAVNGILLLRPLPRTLDQNALLNMINPVKDVDGVTPISFATVYAGYGEGFAPCDAEAAIKMLTGNGVNLKGKDIVVVGHSLVAGRAIAALALLQDATPTICHINSVDVAAHTRTAEIVVLATGNTEGFGAEFFSPEQMVIDVGIGVSKKTGLLAGDADFETVEPLVAAITPVPGGIGPLTVSMLMAHVAQAACRQAGISC